MPPMTTRTIFLSKLIGLYCLILGVAYSVQKDAVLTVGAALLRDAPLTLVFGVFLLILGLAMIIGHNIWHGGPAPVIVTLMGWIAALKGAAFLVLSPPVSTDMMTATHFEQLYYVYMGIAIAIGVYLTYKGFTTKSSA